MGVSESLNFFGDVIMGWGGLGPKNFLFGVPGGVGFPQINWFVLGRGVRIVHLKDGSPAQAKHGHPKRYLRGSS